MLLKLCLALLCVKGFQPTESEVFSSADSLGRLANVEDKLSRKIDSYLGELDHQIQALDSFLNEYYADYSLTDSQGDEYISNPINVYSLIKRTSKGWETFKDAVHNETTESAFKEIAEMMGQLGSISDIEGGAYGLFLMQEVYDLDIESFSEGRLSVDGRKVGHSEVSLSALDMEYVGRVAFNNQFFDRAYEWLRAALKKAQESKEKDETISRIQSEIKTTIKYHDIVLEMKGSPRGSSWKTYVAPLDPKLASKSKYVRALQDNGGKLSYRPKRLNKLSDLKKYETRDQFNALCRGEVMRDPSEDKGLSCTHIHFNDPYLRLGPFMYEALNKLPNIGMFHSFLYESEMQAFVTHASPRLERSTHHGHKLNELKVSFKRTSKQMRLTEEDILINSSLRRVERVVSRRIQQATKFELGRDRGEEYQIANYGIGGVYVPHMDSFGKDDELMGDRFATTMAYLSDVEAGGSTVFPLLGLSIPPAKGSLLMWINKDINGKCHPLSYHGGCPVLSGSKWIANKWIRAFDQWRNFPCATTVVSWNRFKRPLDNDYCDGRCDYTINS